MMLRFLLIPFFLLSLAGCDQAEDDATPWPSGLPLSDSDAFTRELEDAYAGPFGDGRVVTGLLSLKSVYEHFPTQLQRYLETSPAWRVGVRADGSRHASRRIQISGEWIYAPSISSGQINASSGVNERSFSIKVQINLHGDTTSPSRAHLLSFGGAIDLGIGSLSTPSATENRSYIKNVKPYYASQIVVQEADLVVKIHEFSFTPGRRMTRAIIAALEQEFSSLRETLDKGDFDRLIQNYGVIGVPEIGLRSKPLSQGKYDTQLLVNPGAPGLVYIKAFEMPGNSPIFVKSLPKIRERTGWSKNQNINFYANSYLPIRTPQANKKYNTRLEVWFVPDDESPERKLLEKDFFLLPTVL